MKISTKSTSEVIPPKLYLLELKVRRLQELFKTEFNQELCYHKTNDFLVDHFEPSAIDLKNFSYSVNSEELEDQLALHWESSLKTLVTDPSYLSFLVGQSEQCDKQIRGPSFSRTEMESVARRAISLYRERGLDLDPLSLILDLCTAQFVLCDIRLDKLLKFSDEDFFNDISRVIENLNRETGEIENFTLLKSYNGEILQRN